MSQGAKPLMLIPLCTLPLIAPGNDLAAEIVDAARREGVASEPGDVFIIAQKIVSKAAGLFVDLTAVAPSERAIALAAETGKDSRFVEVVLSQSKSVVTRAPNVLITEHLSGCIAANAGVDRSNVEQTDDNERVLLLPPNPDASAEALRQALAGATGNDVGVIINDSWGRPWRLGTAGAALGVAGLAALHDHRGRNDLYGRRLEASVEAVADELAAAANLVMGQADESVPVVIARGFQRLSNQGSARELLRPRTEDLFR